MDRTEQLKQAIESHFDDVWHSVKYREALVEDTAFGSNKPDGPRYHDKDDDSSPEKDELNLHFAAFTFDPSEEDVHILGKLNLPVRGLVDEDNVCPKRVLVWRKPPCMTDDGKLYMRLSWFSHTMDMDKA